MDEDGLPIVGSGVDLTKVPAIQQKRIVAFLNQFIVHSPLPEPKLAGVSLRIQQIETTLSILEAKLSSIPGLEDVKVEGACPTQVSAEVNGSVMVSSSQSEVPAPPYSPEEVGELPKTEAAKENVLTVAKDSRYARYLKMVQVGVPVMAIKNKMIQESLDPSLLDTPDAPVPDRGRATEEADDDSSNSESSFSD